MSSGSSFGPAGGRWPGDGLVVGGVVLEAAVQYADEAVGELAQGGGVAGAAGSLVVVVGAGARRYLSSQMRLFR
jgi:hypothetical protein